MEEWKEKARAHASEWLDGYAVYDVNEARTEVGAWIDGLDAPVDDSDIENMCMNLADFYDVAEYRENVPSRYSGDSEDEW